MASHFLPYLPILRAAALGLLFFLGLSSLQAAPGKEGAAPPRPSIGKVAGDPVVVRGGACEVVLRGIVMPRDTAEFEVAKGPRHGSLGAPRRIDAGTVVFPYRHDGSKGAASDRIEFKLKTSPLNSWGRLTVTIAIVEPGPRLKWEPGEMVFGSVPIGERRTRRLRIRNAGGGVLAGEVFVGAPWSIQGPAEFSLAENKAADFAVEFAPKVAEEQTGRLEVSATGGSPVGIPLRGEGTHRFEAPGSVAFPKDDGVGTLEIPVTNFTALPLRLEILAPSPLVCESALDLPPEGRAVLRLGLEKRHFTEKSVVVSISDGAATRSVRVGLPDPPALLEWAAPGGLVDLGEIPVRNIPRFEIELRNRGATSARVTLRNGEGGLSPGGTQARTFELGSGESAMVQAVWRLPGEQGVFESSLIASHGGLDHRVRARVRVAARFADEGKTDSEAPVEPASEPTPEPFRVLDEAEKNELAARLPANISVRLEPSGRTARAVVSWNYQGPEPVEFRLEKKVVETPKAAIDDPFQGRLQVPGELPKSEAVVKWIAATTLENPVRRLENGSWEGTVTGLEPGYRELRIITRSPPGGPRIDRSSFTVRVDPLPPNPLWKWIAAAIGTFCLLYLLRKKVRSFFSFGSRNE